MKTKDFGAKLTAFLRNLQYDDILRTKSGFRHRIEPMTCSRDIGRGRSPTTRRARGLKVSLAASLALGDHCGPPRWPFGEERQDLPRHQRDKGEGRRQPKIAMEVRLSDPQVPPRRHLVELEEQNGANKETGHQEERIDGEKTSWDHLGCQPVGSTHPGEGDRKGVMQHVRGQRVRT